MWLGYGSKFLERYEGNSFAHEDLARSHQIQSFFKRHLDVVGRLKLFFDIESDFFAKLLPLAVRLLQRFVVQPKVVDDDFFDALRIRTLETEIEQTSLLCQEPLSQLVIPAVSQSTNEVRNVVVLAGECGLRYWGLF